MSGFNPRNPNKYQGTDQFLIPFISRNREPTGADYRQPETGRLYALGSIWQVGKDPTTGVEGDLWMLSKIVANVAYWIQVSAGAVGPILDVQVDAATAPGVNPVSPDLSGLMTVSGAIVVNQSIPIRTHTTALNQYDVEVQYAASSGSSNPNFAGMASFNSNHFDVDANGFVQLTEFNIFNYVQISTANSPYTVLSTDDFISCNSTAGAITVRLPNAPAASKQFIIKDRVGIASTNHINVTTVGGVVLIDGLTSYPISGNFGSIQLIFNGTSYEVF